MKIQILLFILSIFFISDESLGQSDSLSKFTLLEFGFPPGNDYLNARFTIAKNWKIDFVPVGECIVSEELSDSVKTSNEITNQRLSAIYGDNWRKKFEKEVQKELKYQKVARKLIDAQSYIQEKDSLLAQLGNGLHYLLTREENKGEYSAIIFGWGNWDGKSELVVYFDLMVDTKKSAVKMKNDEIRLLEIL